MNTVHAVYDALSIDWTVYESLKAWLFHMTLPSVIPVKFPDASTISVLGGAELIFQEDVEIFGLPVRYFTIPS